MEADDGLSGAGACDALAHLTDDERKRLKRLLAPFLGYLDTILFGDEPVLDPARPPAEKAWPIAERMCKANAQRRRNVLRAAADNPRAAKDDKKFCRDLLTPTLQGPDVASDAATVACPTLEFAVSLLKGRPKPYPHARTQHDIDSAQLWLELFPGKPGVSPPTPPTLKTLDQYPISAMYRDHVRGRPDVETSFWCEWVRMIAKPDHRTEYHKLVSQAGEQKEDFFRFTAGWEEVVDAAPNQRLALKHNEVTKILAHRDLLTSYLAAVVEGAPLTLRLAEKIEPEHVRGACTLPQHAIALFDQSVRYEVAHHLVVHIWSLCFEKMPPDSKGALTSELKRGRAGKLLQRGLRGLSGVLWKAQEVTNRWHIVATTIYAESSPESQKHIMDELTGSGGGDGMSSATIRPPKKREI